MENNVVDKAWERPWSTNEIRDQSQDWNLAGDAGLLHHLQQFSENLLSHANETEAALDSIVTKLQESSANANNVTNMFLGLANNQFVENRVYDDDDDTPSDEKTEPVIKSKEERQAEAISRIKEALVRGAAVVDLCEPVETLVKDRDGKSKTSTVYRIPNPYKSRRLPYLIGTKEFIDDPTIGLCEPVTIEPSAVEEKEEFQEEDVLPTNKNISPLLDKKRVSVRSKTSDSDVDFSVSSNNIFTKRVSSHLDEDSDEDLFGKPSPENSVKDELFGVVKKAPRKFTDELEKKLSESSKDKENIPKIINKNAEGDMKRNIHDISNIDNINPSVKTFSGDLFSEDPESDEDSIFSSKTSKFSGGRGLFNDSKPSSVADKIISKTSVTQTQKGQIKTEPTNIDPGPSFGNRAKYADNTSMHVDNEDDLFPSESSSSLFTKNDKKDSGIGSAESASASRGNTSTAKSQALQSKGYASNSNEDIFSRGLFEDDDDLFGSKKNTASVSRKSSIFNDTPNNEDDLFTPSLSSVSETPTKSIKKMPGAVSAFGSLDPQALASSGKEEGKRTISDTPQDSKPHLPESRHMPKPATPKHFPFNEDEEEDDDLFRPTNVPKKYSTSSLFSDENNSDLFSKSSHKIVQRDEVKQKNNSKLFNNKTSLSLFEESDSGDDLLFSSTSSTSSRSRRSHASGDILNTSEKKPLQKRNLFEDNLFSESLPANSHLDLFGGREKTEFPKNVINKDATTKDTDSKDATSKGAAAVSTASKDTDTKNTTSKDTSTKNVDFKTTATEDMVTKVTDTKNIVTKSTSDVFHKSKTEDEIFDIFAESNYTKVSSSNSLFSVDNNEPFEDIFSDAYISKNKVILKNDELPDDMFSDSKSTFLNNNSTLSSTKKHNVSNRDSLFVPNKEERVSTKVSEVSVIDKGLLSSNHSLDSSHDDIFSEGIKNIAEDSKTNNMEEKLVISDSKIITEKSKENETLSKTSEDQNTFLKKPHVPARKIPPNTLNIDKNRSSVLKTPSSDEDLFAELSKKSVPADDGFGSNQLIAKEPDISHGIVRSKLASDFGNIVGSKNLSPDNQNASGINSQALMPGASLPKKNLESEAAISFDQPVIIGSTLHSTGKDRVKIQTRRRPQSRHARQEAVKTSSENFDSSTLHFSKDSSLIHKKSNLNDTYVNRSNFPSSSKDFDITETLKNEASQAAEYNNLFAPGGYDNSNPLSPSTDEDDLFGIPTDLPPGYGTDMAGDYRESSIFVSAPLLSPLEFTGNKAFKVDTEKEKKEILSDKSRNETQVNKTEHEEEENKLFYDIGDHSISETAKNKSSGHRTNLYKDCDSDPLFVSQKQFTNTHSQLSDGSKSSKLQKHQEPETDDDLFSSQTNLFPSRKLSKISNDWLSGDDNDDLFSSKCKNSDKRSSDSNLDIFAKENVTSILANVSDDDDLFSSKPKYINKTSGTKKDENQSTGTSKDGNIFYQDDDLFNDPGKDDTIFVKAKTGKDTKFGKSSRGSLFSDEDDDDDIFGSSKLSRKQTAAPQEKKTKINRKPDTITKATSSDTFEDPLMVSKRK